MYRILFVCHGNICRSPAAEFIAKAEIARRGLSDKVSVASFAVSMEEIGNDMYPPMKAELRRQGIPFSYRAAQRISQRDYDQADAIYYMDESNCRYLNRLLIDSKGILFPIARYETEFDEVEDPWYTDRFDVVVRQISTCVSHIFDHLDL